MRFSMFLSLGLFYLLPTLRVVAFHYTMRTVFPTAPPSGNDASDLSLPIDCREFLCLILF